MHPHAKAVRPCRFDLRQRGRRLGQRELDEPDRGGQRRRAGVCQQLAGHKHGRRALHPACSSRAGGLPHPVPVDPVPDTFSKAVIGDAAYYKICKSFYPCGSPLETSKGMEELLASNFAKARQLLGEAGYDGTPIVLMHSTDLAVLANLAPVAKAFLEKLPADKYPYVVEHVTYHIETDVLGEGDFEFGLDLLLDSLERLRDRPAESTGQGS